MFKVSSELGFFCIESRGAHACMPLLSGVLLVLSEEARKESVNVGCISASHMEIKE